MARILAIDYGLKRTGIAVTDSMQIIATGLTTVDTSTLMVWLANYFEKEEVEKVIIGLPKNLNNTATDATPKVEGFIKAFMVKFKTMPIQTVDERYSSKLAMRALIDSGVKKKDRQNKALIDEVSATILLQSYMESIS
jgi:putative holliday junction resolvase